MEHEYNCSVDGIILAEDRVHIFVVVVTNCRIPYTNRNVLSNIINIPFPRSTLQSYSLYYARKLLVHNRIFSVILNVTEVLPSRTGCLSPRKKMLQYPLHKWLGGPHSWSGLLEEEKSLFSCREMNKGSSGIWHIV
jgi:hypothetical protein